MQVKESKRFRNFGDGRGVVDTQVHPKVKRAQEAHARLLKRIADRKVRDAHIENGAF